MRIVLDSNVLAAATDMRPASFPFRATFTAEANGHQFLLSLPLRHEYELMLAKRELVARHGLSAEQRRTLINELFAGAELASPPRARRDCPDPRDQFLWDLLEANPESLLVTGERELLRSIDFPGRVLSPREFVERHLR